MPSSIATASSFGTPRSDITGCFTTEAIRLEALLADHGVAARVGQASFSTDSIRYPLQLGLGTTTRRLLGLSHTLAQEAGYSRCRLRREGHDLFLELPREGGGGLRYGDLLERAGVLPADSALIGMMDSGASLMLRITNPSVRHLLVSGEAGIGKSEVLRVLALGLAAQHSARHWRFALLDSRAGSPHLPLRALPHCWAWSEHPEHAVGWLVRLHAEQAWRRQAGRRWPRVLVLLDEVATLVEVGGEIVREVLGTLLAGGPEVGLHLAVGCRDESVLDTLVERFPAHLRSRATGVPGRFRLHHEATALSLTTARLDEREVQGVVTRIRFARPRVVARQGGMA